MRAARAPAAAGLLCLALCSGCGRLAEGARVLEGNRLHGRGDYQAAIASYRAAARGAVGRGPSATIDYDLANAYARLGDYDASAELYARSRAGPEGDPSLEADSRFNEGISLFERGLYREAWLSFRAALALLDPLSGTAAQARRDLELAWRAWKKSAAAAAAAAPDAAGPPGPEGEDELKLFHRLETERWRPGPAALQSPSPNDY